jgi:hypothetical protein
MTLQAVDLTKRLRRLHFDDPYLQNQVKTKRNHKKVFNEIGLLNSLGKLFRSGNI